MKNLLYIIGCACIAISCSTTPKENKASESESIESIGIEDSNANEASSFSDSSQWDQALSDYETLMNDYMKLMKDAKNGDLTAMTKSVELMEKAESVGKSLEEASATCIHN